VFKGANRLANGSYEIRSEFHPGKAAVSAQHEFDAIAVFATGHPVYREAALKVIGRRDPWIDLRPTELYFGPQTAGSMASRTVLVRRHEQSAAVAVSTRHPDILKARLVGDRLTVELVTPNQAGTFQSSVTIRAGEHLIEMPVVAIVTEK
jgi:hypothetical protein